MPYIYIPSPRLRKEIIYLIVITLLALIGAVYLYVHFKCEPIEGIALFIFAIGGAVIAYAAWCFLRYVMIKLLYEMGYMRTSKEHRIHVIHRPSNDHHSSHHHHHHHHHDDD